MYSLLAILAILITTLALYIQSRKGQIDYDSKLTALKYIADKLPELENGLKDSGLKSGQIVCDVKDFDEGFEPEDKDGYSSVHVII